MDDTDPFLVELLQAFGDDSAQTEDGDG
jgi:hypothetical protein